MKTRFTLHHFVSLITLIILFSCNKEARLDPVEDVDLRNGLRYNFPFSGNSIETISGLNYDTHGAKYTTDRFGNPNSALCLDGNYLDLDAGLADSIGTLSFWLQSPDVHLNKQLPLFVGGVHTLALYRYRLVIEEGKISLLSLFRWGVPTGEGWPEPLYTDSVLRPNSWHHIVVRWSDAEELVEVYVDNEKELSSLYLPNWSLAEKDDVNQETVGAEWNYGSHAGNYLTYFKGQMDDLRFYNRRLSDLEVEALYMDTK